MKRDPLLCRLGLHDWLSLGFSDFAHSPQDTREVCSRCGRRRETVAGKAFLESCAQRDQRLQLEKPEVPAVTADELVEDLLQLGPQDLHVLFHYLADHLTEARLLQGGRLNDATDFKAWLRELGDVALVRTRRSLLSNGNGPVRREQERWR